MLCDFCTLENAHSAHKFVDLLESECESQEENILSSDSESEEEISPVSSIKSDKETRMERAEEKLNDNQGEEIVPLQCVVCSEKETNDKLAVMLGCAHMIHKTCLKTYKGRVKSGIAYRSMRIRLKNYYTQ